MSCAAASLQSLAVFIEATLAACVITLFEVLSLMKRYSFLSSTSLHLTSGTVLHVCIHSLELLFR